MYDIYQQSALGVKKCKVNKKKLRKWILTQCQSRYIMQLLTGCQNNK